MRARRATRVWTAWAPVALWAAASGCAHLPTVVPTSRGLAWAASAAADDSTVALYRFDETTGTSMADSSADPLSGTYGQDTRPSFGRFRSAREFLASINSFGYVPPDPRLDLRATWTIEAWVNPTAYAPFQLAVIAARWTESANEQSWVLGLAGQNLPVWANLPPPPDVFATIVGAQGLGRLVFVVQPTDASPARAFASTRAVDFGRWTHVAVTYDGAVLRMFLDGRLDAQYATRQTIRASGAPLVIGNLIDSRWLTRDQGPLRVDAALNEPPYFAFVGAIDELRLSRAARVAGTLRTP